MDVLRLIATLAVGAANAGVALAVLLRNPRLPANRAFAAAVLSVAAWFGLAFLSDQTMLREQALLLNRLTMASSLVMGVFLIYFSRVFPRAASTRNGPYTVFFAAGALVALLTASTPLVITGVVAEEWGTSLVLGPLIWLPSAWLLIGMVVLVVSLVGRYRQATETEKAQLKYLFAGLASFAGFSLLFGLVLPLISGSWVSTTLGSAASLGLVLCTSYAMVHHRLMDIRVVVLRGVAYTLLVLTLGIVLVAMAAVARAELTGSLGISPDAVFVVTALAAVLAFQPFKRLLERHTDRLFYRRTYDAQALLAELGSSMLSTLDLHEMEHDLARSLKEGMRLTHVAIAHVREEGAVEIAGTLEGAVEHEDLRHLIGAPGGELVFADDSDTDSAIKKVLEQLNVRVLVPLVGDKGAAGAILLGPKLSGEVYSLQDAAFLENLSREATISFRNAWLFEELNQRVRELSALHSLAGALGGEKQLEAILDEALAEVMAVTHAEAGSIMLLKADGKTLSIECAHGLPSDVVAAAAPKVGEGIAGWVALNKKPLVVMDAQAHELDMVPRSQTPRSALSVPLMNQGQVIGVLNVSKPRAVDAFTDEKLEVVASFASQLAIAIENARLAIDVGATLASLELSQRTLSRAQTFFAKASHELRTPLNSIIGFGHLLNDGVAGPLNEEQLRMAGMIRESGKRLLELVNDLLDLEKLSTRSAPLSIAEADINGTVAKCAAIVEPLATEKALDLQVELGEIPSI